MDHLKQLIRDIPDFPKPGILFRDITPLLRNAHALQEVVRYFCERYEGQSIDAVVAVESRGFILGATVAHRLGVGLIPVRKRGKLPWKTFQERCILEYGEEILEMHQDALVSGERMLVMDDVLATGGTLAATVRLVERCKAEVVEIACLVELTYLGGRTKLAPHFVFSLLQY